MLMRAHTHGERYKEELLGIRQGRMISLLSLMDASAAVNGLGERERSAPRENVRHVRKGGAASGQQRPGRAPCKGEGGLRTAWWLQNKDARRKAGKKKAEPSHGARGSPLSASKKRGQVN